MIRIYLVRENVRKNPPEDTTFEELYEYSFLWIMKIADPSCDILIGSGS